MSEHERNEQPGTTDELDEPALGEAPPGLGSDLYPEHLEAISRDAAFAEGVISLPDEAGGRHEISLDDVESVERPDDGSHRAKVRLRNGAIVLASGAVIAVAVAAVRYRRKHKQ